MWNTHEKFPTRKSYFGMMEFTFIMKNTFFLGILLHNVSDAVLHVITKYFLVNLKQQKVKRMKRMFAKNSKNTIVP